MVAGLCFFLMFFGLKNIFSALGLLFLDILYLLLIIEGKKLSKLMSKEANSTVSKLVSSVTSPDGAIIQTYMYNHLLPHYCL